MYYGSEWNQVSKKDRHHNGMGNVYLPSFVLFFNTNYYGPYLEMKSHKVDEDLNDDVKNVKTIWRLIRIIRMSKV